jgi:hypothetical protein
MIVKNAIRDGVLASLTIISLGWVIRFALLRWLGHLGAGSAKAVATGVDIFFMALAFQISRIYFLRQKPKHATRSDTNDGNSEEKVKPYSEGPSLRLCREEGILADPYDYDIFLNDQYSGVLSPGVPRTFHLRPGHHALRIVKGDCRSAIIDVDLEQASTKSLRIRSKGSGLKFIFSWWYVLFNRKDYFEVDSPASN